jgi:Domain of unknown function (DUF1996)
MRRHFKPSALVVVLLIAVGAGAPNALASGSQSGGIFHTTCAYSHSLPDDPIVHPNMPGTSHMHDFFGNASTGAFSTLGFLQAATGNCTVHAADVHADRSGYWVPQLLFNGVPTPIAEAQAYYESSVGNVATPPTGLEVIGGDAHATAPLSTNEVKWTCSGSAGSIIGAQPAPPTCPAGSLLKVVVKTPNCLANAQFADPGAMNDTPFTTYAFLTGGHCPSGFTSLPSVRIEVKYPPGVDGRGTITLASGPYYTMHADWFNAWDHATLDAFVQGCIDANIDCGSTVPTVASTTTTFSMTSTTSTTTTTVPPTTVALSATPCTVQLDTVRTGMCTGTFTSAP